MVSWLRSHVRWDEVLVVQRLRCRVGDAWFSYFPLLGNELQYVLLIPGLSWLIVDEGDIARQFTSVAFYACFLANGVKDVLCLPRPPAKLHVRFDEHVAQQYGFPSTHSAHALALSWLLASEAVPLVGPSTAWAVALLNTVHVCVSRMYMGVHSLADIVGGLAIGALVIVLFSSVRWQAGHFVTSALTLTALVVYPDRRASNTAYTEMVQFAGLHLGACLTTGQDAARLVSPRAPATPMQFVLGLIALGAFRTAASAAAKSLVRLMPPRWQDSAAIARHLLVSMLAAWWVLALHPSALYG